MNLELKLLRVFLRVEDVEPTVPPEAEPLPEADGPGAWFLTELVETHWLDVELLLLLLPGEVVL